MADATVLVKQAADGDRPIDNELVLNDLGAMVYRQKVAIGNFPLDVDGNLKVSVENAEIVVDIGTTVEIANDVGNPIPVRQYGATTAATTRVTASITPVTILAMNPARNQGVIYNEAAAANILYVKFGSGASVTDYTLPIAGGGYYEFPVRYLGEITGVWLVAAGFAQVTEF